MRYDLTDLRLFLLVAEAGSITGGAGRAGLALASASARIRGLEAAVGVALLRRDRRGVVPTAAGRAMLHHARAVLNRVEAMAGDMARHAQGLRARVRLLANTAAAMAFLPELLAPFLAAHPGIDVELEERPSHAVVEGVASGSADLGIAAGWAGLAHLERRPFRTDRLAVLAPRGLDLLPGRRDAWLAEVADRPFLGLSPGNPLQEHLQRQAARLGTPLCFRLRVATPEAVARLVAGGAGIAILPEAAIGRGAGLRRLPLRDDWAVRELSLCARGFGALTPQARLLAEALA